MLTEQEKQKAREILRQSTTQAVQNDAKNSWEEFDKLANRRIAEQRIVESTSKRSVGDFFAGAGTGVLKTLRESSETLGKIPEALKTRLPANISSAISAGSALSPAMSKFEKRLGADEGELTEKPETPSGKAGFYTERVAEFLSPGAVKSVGSALKTPLTKAAEKLYQSALKPRNVVKGSKIIEEASDIAKIGLEEKIWLTKGGVEKTTNKINDFEEILGKAIEEGKASGQTIKTQGIIDYLGEAKKLFSHDIDPQKAEEATKQIDEIGERFLKNYGDEIPIEEAQKIKVSTGQTLRKYYNDLSGAEQEARKQGVRFLKEKIVEKSPVIGDINSRLKKLYTFDTALSKASGRIGNLNLLGLGTKFGAAVSGSKGATIGLIADLIDSPVIKSGAGIALNELGKYAQKGSIPLNAIIGLIRAKLED